jgi:pimeloyl-ACP methyl ester carboxylesterase
MNYPTERFTLRDGRQIEFLALGPRHGQAVIYLNGTPGALHDHSQHAELYKEIGICMIAVNRPGTGASTFQERWSALSFADDLKQLLDSLGIAQASVIGFSAGGLYACAFAHQYPERVTRLALLSSIGPFDIPFLGDKRTEATKGFHDAARDHPAALLEQFSAITSAGALLGLVNSLISAEDQRVFARPEIAAQRLRSYEDVMAQGLDKLIREVAIINSPWEFSPAEIKANTLIWHGTADINSPIECSEYFAQVIPAASATYVEGAGHYFTFEQWPELLQAIIVE